MFEGRTDWPGGEDDWQYAGTYTFTVSNMVGSVEGCTKLVVCTSTNN